MNLEIPLRIILAIGMIFLGLFLYSWTNRKLLLRAGKNMEAMFGSPLNRLVIVYFTTPECAPCRTIQRPALEQVAASLESRCKSSRSMQLNGRILQKPGA